MNTISIIFLILLLNTVLGCLIIYNKLEKITLLDLIISILLGMLIFIVVIPLNILRWIEDKTSRIVLLERREE